MSNDLTEALANELRLHRMTKNMACLCGHPYRPGEDIMVHRAEKVLEVMANQNADVIKELVEVRELLGRLGASESPSSAWSLFGRAAKALGADG